MKIKPIAPADAGAEAAALVAQLMADIAALETEIATAESERDAKALELSDDDFEKHVLETERAKRRLLRLEKQLEVASEKKLEALAREKEARRSALYAAGVAAAKKVDELAQEYGRRAEAVAETLQEINKHAEVIRVGNENRPDYAPWSDIYGLRISDSVRLPAAAKGGASIWPLDLPQGRAWQPPTLAELPPPTRPDHSAGPSTIENGARHYVMPPCDFGRLAQ